MISIWVELLLDAPNEKFLDSYLENIKKYADGLSCIGHNVSWDSVRKIKNCGIRTAYHQFKDNFHEGVMRTKSLSLAREMKADYIVIQDADELMNDAFCNEIRDVLTFNDYNWITCPWVNFWDSRDKVRVDGWWFPEYRRRIKVAKVDKTVHIMSRVHYGPSVAEGNHLDSGYFCKHYGYMDGIDRIRKNGRWSETNIQFFKDYENQIGGNPVLVDWIEAEPYQESIDRFRKALSNET